MALNQLPYQSPVVCVGMDYGVAPAPIIFLLSFKQLQAFLKSEFAVNFPSVSRGISVNLISNSFSLQVLLQSGGGQTAQSDLPQRLQ